MIVRRTVSTVVRVGDPQKSCTRIGGEQVARDQHGKADLTSTAILGDAIASLILIAQGEDLLESSIRQNLVCIFVMGLVVTGLTANPPGRRNLGHSAENFPAFRQNGILGSAVILTGAEGLEYTGGVRSSPEKRGCNIPDPIWGQRAFHKSTLIKVGKVSELRRS